jgi:hypothetical protein
MQPKNKKSEDLRAAKTRTELKLESLGDLATGRGVVAQCLGSKLQSSK